ncbi:hypothetical protein E0Z10_g10861 [Xylaria hypoxylon]|uniref:Zn(2)-C6 fungal-type domain-containing protein n=1 Tax=Xylaria hypoxylon TaxID=37992 RepID=A0A4Z0Y1A1_9PEZI|nr:hypothetical protein E0Z10_g10861 [Xylaria hypoxylon]
MVGNNTCLLWGGPSKWNSSMSRGSLASWEQGDALAAPTTLGFAARDRDHFVISSSHAELAFPVITYESCVIGNSENEIGNRSGDPLSNNPLEKWPAPTHSTPQLTPPFVNLLTHPPMSCTDAHSHTHTCTQPTDSIQPFIPGSNTGFTSAGFEVTSAPFQNPLVDIPEMLAFPYGKPPASKDTSESAFKSLVTPCHSGHVPSENHYVGQYDFQNFSNNEPWDERETPGPSHDPTTVTRVSPQSHSLLTSELGFEGGSGLPTTASARPIPNLHKVASGGKRAERPRRPRGQLLPKDRQETSNTRKWKACIRCRMQKIRCIPDPGDPKTERCLCCRKVLSLETKKVIHRIPCLRWNLNEAVLFRVGGLGFTKRWTGVSVENIESCDWVDERVVTIGICITTLLCDPLPLKVRRFKPNGTDIQHRCWNSKETEPPILVTVPAYALADVDITSQEYRWFVGQNAEEAIRRFVSDTTVDDYVRWTFSVAAKAANKEFGKIKGDPTKLFRNYFQLWLASRFTTGSAYIAQGHENLEGKTQPIAYQGRHFISRMITAQFDSIGYKHVLSRLKREVLDELWLLMQKRTDATFFTVYLIVFMMLHEVSVACQDRRRRAKEQGLKTYYDLEDATAKLKHGADIILGHWHYYKGDLDPLTMNEGSIAKAFGTDCPEEVQLLMATCQKYGQMTTTEEKPRDETGWEQDPLCLVSRMFEKNWQPFQSCWP